MRPENSGFVLLTAALVVLLIFSLSLGFLLQMTSRWGLVRHLEAQLYALVLAENGVEYARTLLPQLELEPLLVGIDGQHCGTERPEWRNPMPFIQASEVVPESWSPLCDDGLLAHQGRQLLPRGYQAVGGGRFFLRISNNPEEPPDRDTDREVVVRSMGVIPLDSPGLLLGKTRNSVALVEVRFRQEQPFLLPSPLTLFGESGTFRWQGESFAIDGGESFGVSLISIAEGPLHSHLLNSLSRTQRDRIQGQGITPSIQDAAPLGAAHPLLQPLLKMDFWKHFLDQLPNFLDRTGPGITYLPEGGRLRGSFSGLLVARNHLVLTPGTKLDGLLLHLGEGPLVLETGTRVEGGIWMSNPDFSGATPGGGHLELEISGSARIDYQPEAIRRALAWLPPTQLGWRMLFSETAR